MLTDKSTVTEKSSNIRAKATTIEYHYMNGIDAFDHRSIVWTEPEWSGKKNGM